MARVHFPVLPAKPGIPRAGGRVCAQMAPPQARGDHSRVPAVLFGPAGFVFAMRWFQRLIIGSLLSLASASAFAESPTFPAAPPLYYGALRKYLHHFRRAELNETLILLGKLKWGSRSSPLRNVGTYATIHMTWGKRPRTRCGPTSFFRRPRPSACHRLLRENPCGLKPGMTGARWLPQAGRSKAPISTPSARVGTALISLTPPTRTWAGRRPQFCLP